MFKLVVIDIEGEVFVIDFFVFFVCDDGCDGFVEYVF